MKKMILLAFLASLFLSAPAFADYVGGVNISAINVSDTVLISTTQDIGNTCSYFNAKFRFDATTAKGKNMLSLILMAKAMGNPISVWYSAGTSIGTNETNGCGYTNMAVVHEVAM
ncbi:MAG: hypothetical protein GY874_10940 [Desulfobacteraceae bacterium]|nr:hypothetical protein [Desulfobacteraceae bacterium]